MITGCILFANSLFNIEKLRIYDKATDDPASYVALARILRKVANDPSRECSELFKRLLINIVIGNTDDHARNHAIFFDVKDRVWSLTPAYDVLPILSSAGEQGLSVGLDGRKSSIENALSCVKEFMMSPSDGRSLADDILSKFSGWENHFKECGVTEGDMQLIQSVIGNK